MDATDLYYLTRRLRALLEPEVNALSSAVSLPQQLVFRDVFEFAGATVKEISERRHITQSVVSKAVAEGRDMGLLETRPDPEDGRKVRAFPTPALQEAVYARLSTDVAQILEPATYDLDAAKVDQVVEALEVLLAAIKRHDLPPIDAP